ncbi:MAG: NAD(P)-dependent oxidoreductase [Proteobacteria bacterium]|nr:NAD(P)-dependent oxidoreductase [Pseudomonadota bacterium]
MKVSFIGLGNMGFPMAGHLAAGGHDVTVYNRTITKAETWVGKHGGGHAETPVLAAKGADIAFVCVGNDDDLRSVVFGPDGVLAGLAEGAILVDHTTASAGLAREIAQTGAEAGIDFLDAPVSGGQGGAEGGVLTVMVGGEEAVFERANPVIDCYARAVTLMGPVGSGQLTKMVNQICIVGIIQGLSEGLDFGRRAGLDVSRVVEVISKGAAQSWQMDNRSGTMIEDSFDFGFAANWMRKDLRLCLDEAGRNGALLPTASAIEQNYGRLHERGEGRLDNTALIRLLRKP